MTGSRLAALLDQATPGRWVVDADAENLDVRGEHAVARIAGPMTMGDDADAVVKARALADARLIALAPDMARLLVDMADALNLVLRDEPGDWDSFLDGDPTALLARFAALDEKAGGR